jgi:uncharacterized membrane protein
MGGPRRAGMTDKKKNGVVYGAFMKGLAIALPAFITIAVFVWVWGLLKDNVVAPIIAGLDAPKVLAPREVTEAEKILLGEMKEESDRQFANGGVKTFPDKLLEYDYTDDTKKIKHYKLLRPPLPSEEPELYQGYSPLGKKRSPMQVVLDDWGLKREYDPVNGRVLTYNWGEYVLGSVIGLVFVIVLGFLARNFLGRRLFNLFEAIANKAPVIKLVYPHAKQLVQFFFSDDQENPLKFDTVVVIEWPRKGVWTVGFVTGSGIKCIQEVSGTRLVTVYIPSSPAPMTGYTMLIGADEVYRVDFKVEDVMKWIMTGGVLGPVDEMVRPMTGPQFALARSIDEQVRERRQQMERKTALLDKEAIAAEAKAEEKKSE